MALAEALLGILGSDDFGMSITGLLVVLLIAQEVLTSLDRTSERTVRVLKYAILPVLLLFLAVIVVETYEVVR